MKKTYTLPLIAALALCIPLFASAADLSSGITSVGTLINGVTNNIVKSLITLFATAAMAAFFFGIVQFIWANREGDATRMENGKNFMLWGVIALFVMFSIWGIILFFQTSFGVTAKSIDIPTINVGGSAGGGGGGGGTPAGVGANCAVNSDCNTGLTCIGYKCAQAGTQSDVGGPCSNNSNCKTGLTCGSGFTCVAGGAVVCSQKTTVNDCSAANCTWNDLDSTCH